MEDLHLTKEFILYQKLHTNSNLPDSSKLMKQLTACLNLTFGFFERWLKQRERKLKRQMKIKCKDKQIVLDALK